MTHDLTDCSDNELTALALAGQQTAFGELVRRHQGWVFRLVRSHIGDSEEAVDVTQASFIAAVGALRRYDGERLFRAWLSRIAINKCKDWRRRRNVRRLFAFALPMDEAYSVSEKTPDAERVLGANQDLARTMSAIAELPGTLKEPLILRTIEGYSEAETAQILGISQKAVEMRLYRARVRLLAILQDS
ncbi:RNA polymerase subunit sigma-24 [Gluconobacter oxydans]|uniref:RNA polymerase sigma factor n=1 Tax=Gluconobacter thailandicus TaxID=257438 RepID=UPI00035CE5D3|nr:RNA polymerase sigma factor [Gluconobacter thailandicus]ANQ40031.1 RNA polymerase subunit sigma-24 [Gluconobacter oxydans]